MIRATKEHYLIYLAQIWMLFIGLNQHCPESPPILGDLGVKQHVTNTEPKFSL
jgi:hypothetical protein